MIVTVRSRIEVFFSWLQRSQWWPYLHIEEPLDCAFYSPQFVHRAIDQSGSSKIDRGPRLLDRLLKRIPVPEPPKVLKPNGRDERVCGASVSFVKFKVAGKPPNISTKPTSLPAPSCLSTLRHNKLSAFETKLRVEK